MRQEDLKKDMIVKLKNSSNDWLYKIVQCDEYPIHAMNLKTRLVVGMRINDIEPWVPEQEDMVKYAREGCEWKAGVIYHVREAAIANKFWIEGVGGGFGIHELEPHIVEDKVRVKDIAGEPSGVTIGKAKYEVGDNVEVRSIAGGKYPIHNLPYFFKIESISKLGFESTAYKDFNIDHLSCKKGDSCWFTEKDIVCKLESVEERERLMSGKPKEKCGCGGSGFLNADQIPADVFIEGTEAIIDWIEITNMPFEDGGCCCHCGNPPCSYCTDRTLAEVCSCNDFSVDFLCKDPIEGKTYGDIMGDLDRKKILVDTVDDFGKTAAEMKTKILSDPKLCMTEGDFIGHEDSPDGHGKWMDEFQERGRNTQGNRN